MLIVMDAGHTPRQLKTVVKRIHEMGLKPHVIPGANSTAVGVTGNASPLEPSLFENLPGVKQAIPVSKSYKLPSRDFKHGDTVVKLKNGLEIGGDRLVLIAGPCAVESEEQTLRIARAVKKAGAHILR